MYLAHVAPDNTMPVPGYEHHTLKCPECGDTERRLVFPGDEASPDAQTPLQNPPARATPAKEPAAKEAPVKEKLASAALAQDASAKEPLAQEGLAEKATTPPPDQGREAEPDAQDSPRTGVSPIVAGVPPFGQKRAPAAPNENPPAKWAAAVEKVRTRHTALTPPAVTQPPAPEAAAERPAAASPHEPIDFDRVWENLPPRPQAPRPAPVRAEPPEPRPGVEALAARVRTALQRQPPRKPAAMLAPQAPLAPARPKPAEHKSPAEPKPARSVLSQTAALRGRWARAIAMLRTWPGKAARIEKNDAILQIDADALEVRPRRPD
jgi:hypothetical protein